jgi:hypothetical protein
MNNKDKKSYLIPGAIIAAGLLIAGAIIYSQNYSPSQTGSVSDQTALADKNKNGEKIELSGAQPYSAVKTIIESALTAGEEE